jgi:hypothetical protein
MNKTLVAAFASMSIVGNSIACNPPAHITTVNQIQDACYGRNEHGLFELNLLAKNIHRIDKRAFTQVITHPQSGWLDDCEQSQGLPILPFKTHHSLNNQSFLVDLYMLAPFLHQTQP